MTSESFEKLGSDKYRRIAELGRGGMADVFLAVRAGPAGFNKLLVIKQLRSTEDPTMVTMFLDEARLAAQISHPNVVETYEVVHSPENGEAYMVLEFLDGPSLSRLRRAAKGTGTPVPLALELLILIEGLNGLHAAHELKNYEGSPLNVVHRDFTPQNLMVTYAGQVKIVDFGIAKALDQRAETSAGFFKGKLTYVPPEQLLGDPVDRRADIFAAGVMLYEAITGASPWENMNNATVTLALAQGNIPKLMESSIRDIPPELAAICDQAMAVDPDSRFSTAHEFRDALLDYMKDHDIAATQVQLSGYVSTLLKSARLKTRQLIEQQIRQPTTTLTEQILPHLEGLTPSPQAKIIGRSLPSLMTSTSMPDTGKMPLDVTVVEQTKTKKSNTKTFVLVGGIAALFILGGILGALFVGSSNRPQADGKSPNTVVVSTKIPTAAEVVPAAIEPMPPKPVPSIAAPPVPLNISLRVVASPAEAVVLLDGKPLLNPFFGSKISDNEIHQITASAQGYEDFERAIQFDRDLDMSIALVRSPTRNTRNTSTNTTTKRQNTPVTAPVATPVVEVAPAKTEADPDYFPPPAPKAPPKRRLDNVEF